jgi:hypothetical protein
MTRIMTRRKRARRRARRRARWRAEGDEDRDAASHGPRCMGPMDPATWNSFPTPAK